MSLALIKGDATIKSMGEVQKLVMTPLAAMLSQYTLNVCSLTMPGKNVVTVFINKTLNTEDASSVSEYLAKSGALSSLGYINYPLPKDVGYIKIGIPVKDQYWWAHAIEGMVINIKMSKVGDSIATVYIALKEPRVGGKLGSVHGLKFTIGELLLYTTPVISIIVQEEMPSITNNTTDKSFMPSLLISTKKVTCGLRG